jgi:hypothetical protein
MSVVLDDPLLNAGRAYLAQQAANAATVEQEKFDKPESEIPQPNESGEFATPADGAIWMAATYGIPQIPLNGAKWDIEDRKRGKVPFLQDWPAKASTDLAHIRAWAQEYSGCNFGSVAVAGKHFIFEADSTAVRERIKTRGHDFTSRLIIESSPGKGHRYYLSAPGITNIGQDKNQDFSIRANGEQCVSPGSIHPRTGKQYRVAFRDRALTPPTPEEINFWNNERVEKKSGDVAQAHIPEGQRNSVLATIAGKLVDAGMAPEKVKTEINEINEARCVPPLSRKELEETIFQSVDTKWSKKQDAITRQINQTPLLGGVPVGQQAQTPVNAGLPEIPTIPHPTFPRWVMNGTSLYEGFVKPVCDKNTRYPEFMFMPAMALMLNYLGLKVRVEYKNLIPSLYLMMIGRKGRVIKSTSAQDAIDYLTYAGILEDASHAIRNAEGKTLVFTPGSAEGLGLEMARTSCKNTVLFYDEVSNLVNKAGIEKSSLGAALLLMYESKKFSNLIKGRKESYNHAAGAYCTSLIACTTDKDFTEQWSQLTAGNKGLDERFMFIYQPEELVPLTPFVHVDTKDAALETRKRIDKAVRQGVYSIDDMTPLEQKINQLGNRAEIRAEKIALYFAIDLGRDSIDGECIERALAIVEYEKAVKRYLGGSDEAVDALAAAQTKYCRLLQRAPNATMEQRELKRAMNYRRYSTELWYRIEYGLQKAGRVMHLGSGKPGDPVIVRLLETMIEDE